MNFHYWPATKLVVKSLKLIIFSIIMFMYTNSYYFVLQVHIVVMEGYDGQYKNISFLGFTWGLNKHLLIVYEDN